MLVLSRKKDETIRINDDIIITVIEVRGEKCKIGIFAPPEVRIHRGEIYEEILKEGKRGV